MMRRVPAAPPAHNTQRPAPALPSSSGRNGKFLRAALAALVVAACSILYYRANYGRTLAASLEAAPPEPREPLVVRDEGGRRTPEYDRVLSEMAML